MFKQVAAIPGDRIRVSMASVMVNGAVLPFSSQLTHSEKWPWVRLPHQAGEFVLGLGQYWVYGGGARPALAAQSFDSRYWGPVRRVDIRRVTRQPPERLCSQFVLIRLAILDNHHVRWAAMSLYANR